MSIQSITTDFTNKGIKLLSQLGNNNDSLVPMLVKDSMANGAVVYTYSKEGGKDDAREKAIEGFGTGAVWLLMIPALKWVIDKTVYPFFKLNPNLDTNLIISPKDIAAETARNAKLEKANPVVKFFGNMFHDGINKSTYKNIQDNFINNSTNPASLAEKEILSTLKDKNETAKNIITKLKLPEKLIPTNAQMYKGFQIGKFALATGISAVALVNIIKLKQKSTEERIKKDVKKKNNASKILINKNLTSDNLHQNFTSKLKNNNKNNIPFTGLSAFMTNPILNTLILDGVITSTRRAEARKGEKKEVAFKAICQIAFIYGLAKPIQAGFEKLGKCFKMPVGLDPKVLFDKDLKTKILDSKDKIKEIKNSEKNIIEEIYKLDPKHSLIDILEKNGALKTVEKDGNKAVSMISAIKEKDLLKSFNNIEDLAENIQNIKTIKGYKVFSILANVAIATIAMGVIQPKATILLRKMLNNGDHRNPAIKKLEEEMHKNPEQA